MRNAFDFNPNSRIFIHGPIICTIKNCVMVSQIFIDRLVIRRPTMKNGVMVSQISIHRPVIGTMKKCVMVAHLTSIYTAPSDYISQELFILLSKM